MTVRQIYWSAAALFFISGFAALVYQVIWVRELGLLFGSTAQAAALAIAVFFAGLAAGGWFWGHRAARFRSPLAVFGLLEVGVAVTASGFFLLTDTFHAVFGALQGPISAVPGGEVLLQAALATLILFPPAFLMGGTFPLMAQCLVTLTQRLATTGTGLYALNTLGSASGALAAGFFLPMALGFNGTYLLAIALDGSVGVAALLLARWVPVVAATGERAEASPSRKQARARASAVPASSPGDRLVLAIAIGSGVSTLGVEVLWTRLFAQVLQNSVYTYAIVLVAFLAALGVGSLLANALARWRRLRPQLVLGALLLAATAVTASSPWTFHMATGGLDYVARGAGWAEYLAAVSLTAFLLMALPGVLLGAILPYLLRLLEVARPEPGRAVGRLVAANTVGGIVGAVATGFFLLPLFGVTGGLLVLAAVYPGLLALLTLRWRATTGWPASGQWLRATPALALTVALLLVRPDGLTPVRLDAGEQLLELQEGTHATVAAVETDAGDRLLRVNNFYTLGSTRALESERNQALIPMMTHPNPERVFFLGMGTGITAGASLSFPVERVDVCELLPEVVDLAETHFQPWTQGLFEDERVRVRARDGHHCLRHADTEYDVIISDLFTPWKAGTGNLYTREHFETVRSRLAEDGVFAQWLPLYQLTDRELRTIARTMDTAFPQVVVWRGDLFPDGSIIALVGTEEGVTLDPHALAAHGRRLADAPGVPDALLEASALRFYAGRVTDGGLFDDASINTLNRPVIEYQAPEAQRRVQAGEAAWMIARQLGHFYEVLAETTPSTRDPYLANLDARQHGYVQAGRHFFHHNVLQSEGEDALAARHLDAFLALTPFQSRPPDAGAPEGRSRWEETR